MMFPIIKVKDKHTGYVQIVGSNSHDRLYVDEETGGIQYLDLQCMSGTKKYSNEASCEFIGSEPNEYETEPTIEFVTIEQLIEIAIENMKKQTETKLELDKIIKKFISEQENCKEKLKDAIFDTSGMTY